MFASVSIHATLAGGDGYPFFHPTAYTAVSIHATLAGGDSLPAVQSRHRLQFFYPRHPRGWRLALVDFLIIPMAFLSTPPSRVATLYGLIAVICISFLSTPPSRVATSTARSKFPNTLRFYPRHPRGWRLHVDVLSFGFVSVSIHATLAGGDGLRPSSETISTSFYPRHPRGWRRPLLFAGWLAVFVSIHATLAGGDGAGKYSTGAYNVSIHATLAGGDASAPGKLFKSIFVSIHATLAGGDDERPFQKVF